MDFKHNDGGRKEAGYQGTTTDCTCRAISIATDRPYQEIYELLNAYGKQERKSKRRSGKSSARTGVYKATIRKVMKDLGWTWVPKMFIGQGCKTHLKANELPIGRLVVSVSKHTTCVINGVLNDTYDCSRDETRCVYGYYTKP